MSEPCRIVTGANALYFYFAQGLLLSLKSAAPEPSALRIGFLDLGCTEAQLEWLDAEGINVVPGRWDLPFASIETTPRHFQAMTARPFLDRYFPDEKVQLWIDSDAWVQDWSAVEAYIAAASRHEFAITPEVHRCYAGMMHRSRELEQFMETSYREAFGEAAANRFASWAVLNTGVCAYRVDSRLLVRWREHLEEAMKRTRHFMVELVSLNHALYSEFDRFYPSAVGFLPATCNWMCHQSAPMWDEATASFVAPAPPYERIGILHRTTDVLKQKGTLELRTVAGGRIRSSVEFLEGRYSNEKPEFALWQEDSGWAS